MADSEDDVEVVEDTSAAATLFDLRTVIGSLFAAFGLILLIVALTDTTQKELDKAGGIHLNLWTGIIMIAAAAFFFVWVKRKPPLTGHVEDHVSEDDRSGTS